VGVFLATIALLFHDSVIAFDAQDIWVELTALALFSVLYIINRKHEYTREVSHFLIGSVFVLLDATWYFNRGMGLGVALLFFTAVVIGQVLIDERFRRLFTLLSLLNMAVLLAIEAFVEGFFILGLYNTGSEFPMLTKAIFIFITFVLTSWVIGRLKQEYDLAYQLTLAQQKELEQKNQEIRGINEELEEKIDERSREVIQNQKRLLKYSFFHSHNLRGPLTTLLTIHEALSLQDLTVDEMSRLITMLEEETVRLDKEVREIQYALQENEFSELYHIQAKEQK
jgi:signal transduction histidine kinase